MNFEEKKNYMDQTLDFKINNGLNINYLNKKFGKNEKVSKPAKK